MEKNSEFQSLVNVFNTYRANIDLAIKKWTISEDRFELRNKLYETLWKLGISSLVDMQNNDYINKLAFWIDDKTYVVIKDIENQIEDVFQNKTDKTLQEIYKEKNDYIDELSEEQRKRYENLMQDPLFYLLLGWTDETKWNIVAIIDERQFADDILKNKEKLEKIQEALWYIQDYRKVCKEVKNENDFFVEWAKFTNQLINNIWFAWMSFWIEESEPKKYQKFVKMIWCSLKDQELIKDPIISGITWGSPSFKYKDRQMVDDEILAKAIVESL